VLQMLNRHFEYLWDTSMFSTAIYAVVDAERREMHWACAGHPLPLLVREGAAVRALTVDAVPPLLLMPVDHIPTTRVTLAQGDRVVFYTDGITERLDGQEHMYELERLVGLLDRSGGVTAAALVERVIADVSAFAAGHESEDDQTLVVVGFP
jgi:phosphoserine phosphatase RsbU/P